MVFSDTTTNQGLYQDALFIVSQNSTSYPIADFTRHANSAMDKVTGLILGADGTWNWDDTNNTDLPIGTADVISGQQDYSFDDDFIVIRDMEIEDSSGTLHKLIPLDRSQYTESLETVFASSGLPIYYDKLGSSILLYPTPNYNNTGGLKAYFQRKGSYFATTDTTKEPGIANHLHRYISFSAAYDYALAKGLSQLNAIKNELIEMEAKVKAFYSYREKDVKPTLQARREDTR